MKNALLIILFSFSLFSCNPNDDGDYEDLPNLEARLNAGGETTVFSENSNAFSTPAANLYGTDLDDHISGDANFESAFVTAPATVNGGLGTIFNNTTCVSCHPKDGRASFPSNRDDKPLRDNRAAASSSLPQLPFPRRPRSS